MLVDKTLIKIEFLTGCSHNSDQNPDRFLKLFLENQSINTCSENKRACQPASSFYL